MFFLFSTTGCLNDNNHQIITQRSGKETNRNSKQFSLPLNATKNRIPTLFPFDFHRFLHFPSIFAPFFNVFITFVWSPLFFPKYPFFFFLDLVLSPSCSWFLSLLNTRVKRIHFLWCAYTRSSTWNVRKKITEKLFKLWNETGRIVNTSVKIECSPCG